MKSLIKTLLPSIVPRNCNDRGCRESCRKTGTLAIFINTCLIMISAHIIYFCMHHHAIPSALYPATRLSQPLYCIFSFSLSMPFWLHCVLFIYSTQDHIRIKLKKWDGKWRRKSCIHICSGRINISSRGRLVV